MTPDPEPASRTGRRGGERAPDAASSRNSRGGVNFRRFWLALYRRDVTAAEIYLRQLLKLHRPQKLYLRLFIPTLGLSGSQFRLGKITYHDEHYITHQCLRMMRIVRHAIPPAPPNGRYALATGVGQDSHRIGLRMVGDLLGATGWEVKHLPTNERGILRRSLRERMPDAILISIGRPEEFEQARRMIREARQGGFTGPVAVGGRAIDGRPDAIAELGATLTASNGLELSRKLAPYLTSRPRGPSEVASEGGDRSP